MDRWAQGEWVHLQATRGWQRMAGGKSQRLWVALMLQRPITSRPAGQAARDV